MIGSHNLMKDFRVYRHFERNRIVICTSIEAHIIVNVQQLFGEILMPNSINTWDAGSLIWCITHVSDHNILNFKVLCKKIFKKCKIYTHMSPPGSIYLAQCASDTIN